MRSKAVGMVVATVVVFGAVVLLQRAWTGVEVAAGFAAKLTCSLSLNSGQKPEAIRSELLDRVLAPVSGRISMKAADCCASASVFGLVHARAVYRRGFGCTLLAGIEEQDLTRTETPPSRPALDPNVPWPLGEAGPTTASSANVTGAADRAIASAATDRAIASAATDRAIASAATDRAIASAAPDRAIASAIDEAFREQDDDGSGRVRQTKAVVVVHRGQLVAERYADGYTAATPMISWSMAKSVLATLVGIAVSDRLLALDEPAPVPEWSAPDDPRHAITLDQLLRMSSGLAFDENYGAVNDVSRMLFTEPDTAHFAADFPPAAAPGSRWSYSSGTSNIVARLLFQRLGGDLATFVRFARERLFDPASITSAFFEPDASGTPVGSSFVFMTARDWARFGELHRNDGMWNGKRVLPEGWVRYVTTPAPQAPDGRYGAHWWLNAGDPADPARRLWPSLPSDAYAARGYSGQWVLVIPSRELVIVRLGIAVPDDGKDGTVELAKALIDAVAGPSARQATGGG